MRPLNSRWPLHPASVQIIDQSPAIAGPQPIEGVAQTIVSPAGHWMIVLSGIPLFNERILLYRALLAQMRGPTMPVLMPFFDWQRSPRRLAGLPTPVIGVPYSDGAPYSDGTVHSQVLTDCALALAARAGDTRITVNVYNGVALQAGHYIGFNGERGHMISAMFPVDAPVGDMAGVDGQYELVLWPRLRMAMPAGEPLDTEDPLVLVCLTSQSRARALALSKGRRGDVTLEFTEANWV